MIGTVLAALMAFVLVAIGLGAFVAPRASVAAYGFPTDDAGALALIRAMGARDLALGIIAGVFLSSGARGALGVTLGVSTLIAVADLWIVSRRSGGAARRSLAAHAGGAVLLLSVWVLLRAGI